MMSGSRAASSMRMLPPSEERRQALRLVEKRGDLIEEKNFRDAAVRRMSSLEGTRGTSTTRDSRSARTDRRPPLLPSPSKRTQWGSTKNAWRRGVPQCLLPWMSTTLKPYPYLPRPQRSAHHRSRQGRTQEIPVDRGKMIPVLLSPRKQMQAGVPGGRRGLS